MSTTNRVDREATGRRTSTVLADAELDDVFAAVVDATEEAVINALFVADTVTGRDGFVARGLPVDRIIEWLGDPRDEQSARMRVDCSSHRTGLASYRVTIVRDCSRRYCCR